MNLVESGKTTRNLWIDWVHAAVLFALVSPAAAGLLLIDEEGEAPAWMLYALVFSIAGIVLAIFAFRYVAGRGVTSVRAWHFVLNNEGQYELNIRYYGRFFLSPRREVSTNGAKVKARTKRWTTKHGFLVNIGDEQRHVATFTLVPPNKVGIGRRKLTLDIDGERLASV